jgi:hypothetical protein
MVKIVSELDNQNELERFTSNVLRGPETSVKSMLISQHLVFSTTSKPLEAIIHICRAAAMLNEKTLKDLEINPEIIDVILSVALKLHDVKPIRNMDQEKYNISFYNLPEEYMHWSMKKSYSYFMDHNKKEIHDRIREKGGIEYFFYICTNLSEAGYRALVTDFIREYLPACQRIAEKVSQLIDQEIYHDTLQLLIKPREAE